MSLPLTRQRVVIYNRAVFGHKKRFGCGLLVLALGSVAWAQKSEAVPAPQNTPTAADTMLVTCGDKPPLASHTMKGDVLVAPDGKHRAYAEVEAKALSVQRANGYTGPLCINNSRLLVSADTGAFELRFLQEPADVETGNSLRLVDWSSDSRRLLAELADWQYEQPGVAHSILIYDNRYGTFQQPDLTRALAKLYNRDCAFNFRVLGFAGPGTIALEAQPLTPEEEEIAGVSSCARKKTYFEMDRATENMLSLTEAPKLQHNAKVEAGKP
ncbi:MAG TPA: hypothetical protein VK466_12635 [Terriglobales bacterium]|nr:hypothetical protein [Terriglobales bacterium]